MKPPFYQPGQVYFLKPRPVYIHSEINFYVWNYHSDCPAVTSKSWSKPDTTKTVILVIEVLNIEFLSMKKFDNRNFFSFFIIKPTRCTNFTNLFWHEILNVSDSSSVHHQELIHCSLCTGIYTYNVAECTVNKLLMIDRRTVRNM